METTCSWGWAVVAILMMFGVAAVVVVIMDRRDREFEARLDSTSDDEGSIA